MESSVIGFTPLDLSHLGQSTSGLLEKGISKMERGRNWSGKGGIAEMLGVSGASCVEEVLAKGGTALEIGGGNLTAAKELAKKYPGGKLVVIEPFVDQNDLVNLPENIKVIANKLEDVGDEVAAGSIDVGYSAGHVLNYVEDKLQFLKAVWNPLKNKGRAFIEFFGSPMSPSIDQVVEKFGLNQSLNVTNLGGATNVLEITKAPDQELKFGEYELKTSLAGNFPGDVNSEYQFLDQK